LNSKRVLVAGLVGLLVGIGITGVIIKVREELAVRAEAREARRLIAERKFEEAAQPLDRWLKARPGSAEALFLTAKGMFAASRTDQGFLALERARSLGYPPQPVRRHSSSLTSEGTTKLSRS
jgi:thioredoxin-like negative regulator of GroEL